MRRSLLVCFLTGCAVTNTPADPAPDITVVQDAGVDAFAPNLDAFTPDAPSLDAFSPDAFTPPLDICNDIDDDSDGAVDEGGSVACSVAPNGERAVCESGVCLCRASGTPPVVGGDSELLGSTGEGFLQWPLTSNPC